MGKTTQVYRLSSDFEALAKKTIDEELSANPSVSLKKYYMQCFDQAVIDGVPADHVTRIVRDRLNVIKRKRVLRNNPKANESECLINYSWYYQVASEAGVIEKSVTASSITVTESRNSSHRINREFIEQVNELRGACDLIISALKSLKDDNGDPIEINNLLTEKQHTNFIEELKTTAMIVKTTFDGKTKVPQNTHHLFRACVAVEAGLFAACKAYMAQRTLLLNQNSNFITKKQTNKFRTNEEPDILSIYKPKDRDEAIYQGNYGVQCKCGSWRVKEKLGNEKKVQCIDCNVIFKGVTISHCKYCQTPFYDSVIKKIKNNGKCPECKTATILPESF